MAEMAEIRLSGLRGGITARVADSFASRGRGLLGRPPLAPGAGLLIRPCASVHTWFMRQTLDLVGLRAAEDGRLEITWLSQDVPPWRVRFARRGATQILELPAGEAARLRWQVGDQLLVAN